jgi:molybdate/tungstate transport system substrate-binding protein
MTRRTLISRTPLAAFAAFRRHLQADDGVLDVAYAGSMASIMEGPIKQAVAETLHLSIQGRAQGASGLAQLIVAGSIRPDVFISVTPSPMKTVLQAGLAQSAVPIAHTEMVIAYSPNGRFASRFRASGQPNAEPWWKILQEPGLRFGRTDPVTDPQGRNIIFVMQLAAGLYNQPDLASRILGADINPEQIFSEPSVEARLQSGQLDAASAYKIQPGPFHLPFLTLPAEINLGGAAPGARAEASLTLNGKTYHPEPLVYYAASLRNAPHAADAARFVTWLQSSPAREILRRFDYDPPGNARELDSK